MMKVAVLGSKKSEKVVEDSRENWVIHDGPSSRIGDERSAKTSRTRYREEGVRIFLLNFILLVLLDWK